MYNRYIPQPDGTYRRNRMNDSPETARKAPPPIPEPVPREPCSECPHAAQTHRPKPPQMPRRSLPAEPLNFWRQLLPKDFQTEDLIVVLLLLLMAGDCREDQNTALLTLALYLFV